MCSCVLNSATNCPAGSSNSSVRNGLCIFTWSVCACVERVLSNIATCPAGLSTNCIRNDLSVIHKQCVCACIDLPPFALQVGLLPLFATSCVCVYNYWVFIGCLRVCLDDLVCMIHMLGVYVMSVSNQATTNQCIRLQIMVCACVYVYVYVYVSVCVGVCVSVFVCGVHNHPHLPWGFVHKSMVERAL